MLYIDVLYAKGNTRSKTIAQSMARGIKKVTQDSVRMVSSQEYKGISADIAVFYGLSEGLDKVMEDYSKNSTVVFVDLGYWNRRMLSRYDGYHKITVNSRHPTNYFQNFKHSPSRFKEMGIDIKPWRKSGTNIIVAGMSAKAAWAEKLNPEEWEKQTIRMLSATTKRPILYRPKPNWTQARVIRGSILQRNVELDQAFRNCHAVVTHHSNVAVDAILAGVPAFCVEGVAYPMSLHDIRDIDRPYMPEDRHQWANDIAWCQWTTAEMEEGLPWRHLKNEGLI